MLILVNTQSVINYLNQRFETKTKQKQKIIVITNNSCNKNNKKKSPLGLAEYILNFCTFLNLRINNITDTFVQGSKQLANPIEARSSSISSDSSVGSREHCYYDLESGEQTPLLTKRLSRFRASNINIGVLALGIILIGGVTIGTYLLMEDRE